MKENSMTITWLGHSCFKVESAGYSVVLDPYGDGSVPGLPPLSEKADRVLVSHGHGDHSAAEKIRICRGDGEPFAVTVIDTWHDDADGAERGPNKIHILEKGGMRVAHMGDLGCGLTDAQAEILYGLDAVMIPVGGFYTIDARQAQQVVESIRPRVVIPMHYRGEDFGFGVLSPLSAFLSLRGDAVYYDTGRLELTRETEPQTAVLKIVKNSSAG